MPSLKTSIEAKIKGLVFKVDYLENQCCIFIQKNYGRKRHLPCTHILFSGLYSLFFHLYLKKKMIIRLFPSSLKSFYYFLLFFGLKDLQKSFRSFKTQFKD